MEEAEKETATQGLVEVIGDSIGQIAIALTAITRTLKSQPGFDCVAFDDEIRERLSRIKEGNAIVTSILSAVLDQAPASEEAPAVEALTLGNEAPVMGEKSADDPS